MLQLNEFEQRNFTRQGRIRRRVSLVSNRSTCDLGIELSALINASGKFATIIDSRTLVDKKTLWSEVIKVPDGTLIIDHVLQIPPEEKQDIVAACLRWIFKGDYLSADDNTSYGEEGMDYLAHHNIDVIGIIDQEDEKSPLFNQIIPKGGGCSLSAYADQGLIAY